MLQIGLRKRFGMRLIRPLGHTIDVEKVRNAYLSARDNTAEENLFRHLRLNQWVKQSTRWRRGVPVRFW